MTREEAIEEIKRWSPILLVSGQCTEKTSKAQDMAVSALSKNRGEWIPTSVRLPKIHQDVLLSLRSLDVDIGFRAENEPYFYVHGYYIEPQDVLAWQPLPKPYKAKRGET